MNASSRRSNRRCLRLIEAPAIVRSGRCRAAVGAVDACGQCVGARPRPDDDSALRVCPIHDYERFSFVRADRLFEPIDVDSSPSPAAGSKVKPRLIETTGSTR